MRQLSRGSTPTSGRVSSLGVVSSRQASVEGLSRVCRASVVSDLVVRLACTCGAPKCNFKVRCNFNTECCAVYGVCPPRRGSPPKKPVRPKAGYDTPTVYDSAFLLNYCDSHAHETEGAYARCTHRASWFNGHDTHGDKSSMGLFNLFEGRSRWGLGGLEGVVSGTSASPPAYGDPSETGSAWLFASLSGCARFSAAYTVVGDRLGTVDGDRR